MLSVVAQSKDGNRVVSGVDSVVVDIPRLCQRAPWDQVASAHLQGQAGSEVVLVAEADSAVDSVATVALVDGEASGTRVVAAGLVRPTDLLQMPLLVLAAQEAVVMVMTGATTTDLDIAGEAGMIAA